MLEIVAGTIGPMLAELSAVAVKRAAVAAGAQSLDDDPRGELQVFDRRDDGWRKRGHTQSRTHGGEQLLDYRIGRDAVRFGLEVHEHAMAKDRKGHASHVVWRGDRAPIEQRPRFGAEQERLSRAGS